MQAIRQKLVGVAVSLVLAGAFVISDARAGIVTDQEQPLIDPEAGFLGIGGDSEQQLAQSFTVGRTGELVGFRLPIAGCNGDLVMELRRTEGGRPTGELLRAVRIAPADVPATYAGFRDYYFRTGVDVTAGELLAFTLRMDPPTASCSHATAPVGDPYPRGNGFFDSRPNPPGWVSAKEFPSDWQDLPFYSLMDDPTVGGRSSGRCVIPDRIDPSTGRPLELPISRFTPACRCFEDAGAREFRCGVFHPDFFIIRRFPFPLVAGKPFEETWTITPLTELDGPVTLTLSGAGFSEAVKFSLPTKGKLSTVSKAVGRRATVTLKAVAPEKPIASPGVAVIEYPMKDAEAEFQTRFGLDIGISEDDYAPQ